MYFFYIFILYFIPVFVAWKRKVYIRAPIRILAFVGAYGVSYDNIVAVTYFIPLWFSSVWLIALIWAIIAKTQVEAITDELVRLSKVKSLGIISEEEYNSLAEKYKVGLSKVLDRVIKKAKDNELSLD